MVDRPIAPLITIPGRRNDHSSCRQVGVSSYYVGFRPLRQINVATCARRSHEHPLLIVITAGGNTLGVVTRERPKRNLPGLSDRLPRSASTHKWSPEVSRPDTERNVIL